VSVFCRHNRFVADCPICSKGTVLDQGAGTRRKRSAATSGGTTRSRTAAPTPAFSGPHVAAGPWEDDEGQRYMVRLEKVPGGIRLAEWAGSQLRRRAPVIPAEAVAELVAGASDALGERDGGPLAQAMDSAPGEPGDAGVSPGRSGDFKEELRVERLEDGRVRIARWVLRPGRGWQLQDAPPMLPAARYAQALGRAVGAGVLASASGDAEPSRP
jgi:hypothetical protein